MFRLLIESLLSPWELHNSLISAINNELHFGKTDEKNKKRLRLVSNYVEQFQLNYLLISYWIPVIAVSA